MLTNARVRRVGRRHLPASTPATAVRSESALACEGMQQRLAKLRSGKRRSNVPSAGSCLRGQGGSWLCASVSTVDASQSRTSASCADTVRLTSSSESAHTPQCRLPSLSLHDCSNKVAAFPIVQLAPQPGVAGPLTSFLVARAHAEEDEGERSRCGEFPVPAVPWSPHVLR